MEDRVWDDKDAYVNAMKEYDSLVQKLFDYENTAKLISYPLPSRHEEIINDQKSKYLRHAERYTYFNKNGERCSQYDVEEEDAEDFAEEE